MPISALAQADAPGFSSWPILESRRRQQQMRVIAHEHLRVQRNVLLLQGLAQPLLVAIEALVIRKCRGAIDAAMGDTEPGSSRRGRRGMA